MPHTRTALTLAALLAPLLAGCAHAPRNQIVAAAVFSAPRGGDTDFTFQGVLHENAQPKTGTMDLVVGVSDNSNPGTPLLAQTSLPNVEFDNGRFEVIVNPPTPDDLIDFGRLYISVADAFGTELVPRIRMTHTPRAITAELARRAHTADVATEAANLIGDDSTALTLENGWTDVAGTAALPTATRVGGMVFLNGTILPGTLTTTITTLPPAFRPAERHIFAPASYNTSQVRIDIFPDGTVVHNSGDVFGYVSFDGIAFPVAP